MRGDNLVDLCLAGAVGVMLGVGIFYIDNFTVKLQARIQELELRVELTEFKQQTDEKELSELFRRLDKQQEIMNRQGEYGNSDKF